MLPMNRRLLTIAAPSKGPAQPLTLGLQLCAALGLSFYATQVSAAAVSTRTVADTVISVHPNMGNGNTPQGAATYLGVIGLRAFETSTLLQFDLSAWASHTVIGDGRVRLQSASLTYTNQVTINTFAVTQAWGEDTVTWNNFVHPTGQRLSSETLSFPEGSVFSFEIVIPRTTIQTWLDQPSQNHGLLIEANSPYQRDLSFASKEFQPQGEQIGALAPQLRFDIAGEVPESSMAALSVAGLLGLTATRRRVKHKGMTA